MFTVHICFPLKNPGLDPVPSLEALETTMDSSGTPSMLPVPSFEPPVLGCLLLIFLLSLRAFIMSAARLSSLCGLGFRFSICIRLVSVICHPVEEAELTQKRQIPGLLLFADLPWFNPAEGPSSSSSSDWWRSDQ
ncbi:hypothetical protein Tco_0883901 [Tanacetum coccineum]